MTLHGASVIVTGGASGIGRACAGLMASLGGRVTIADIDADGGVAAASELQQQGKAVRFHATDITSRRDVKSLVDEVRRVHGRVDVLAHVAAIAPHIPFIDLSEDDWHEILDVCLSGAFHVNQEVARAMVADGGGRIINFASSVGATGGTVHSAYSAAKAGVVALSKSMQRELAGHGVVVMVVAPGATDTPLYRRDLSEERLRARAKAMPFGRPARPEEVAEVVAFLADTRSAHLLAGQTIHTNGGGFMGF